MRRSLPLAFVAVLSMSAVLVFPAASGAAPVRDDQEWNELYPTTGLTWAQVESVCPTDGATPCDGVVGGRDLTGWVWATADQVLALMEHYAPGISSATPPVSDAFGAGVGFLNDFRWTTYTALTYFYTEYTSGWTASRDANGLPISGGASFQTPFFSGSLGLGATPDAASAHRGVFLWRPAGLGHTGPVVTPTLVGTLGTNGWYRSDVAITWTVSDPESEIVSTTGCDPATVTTDSPGTVITCAARSAGWGPTTTSGVTIRRDVTSPVLTCGPRPTFALGQSPARLGATVADTTSGVDGATVTVTATTATAGSHFTTVTAVDRAGNPGSARCPYDVVVPTCRGRVPTIVGTGGNDRLTGTNGVDVIVGLQGADQIDGVGGADVICAGDGPDSVLGGRGADVIEGGSDTDDLSGGDGPDDLDGGPAIDSLRGDGGADRCTSGERRMSSCAVLY